MIWHFFFRATFLYSWFFIYMRDFVCRFYAFFPCNLVIFVIFYLYAWFRIPIWRFFFPWNLFIFVIFYMQSDANLSPTLKSVQFRVCGSLLNKPISVISILVWPKTSMFLGCTAAHCLSYCFRALGPIPLLSNLSNYMIKFDYLTNRLMQTHRNRLKLCKVRGGAIWRFSSKPLINFSFIDEFTTVLHSVHVTQEL